MGNPSPRYTAEFKQKAVELYRKSGTTYAEVARGLGCDAGSLSDWVKKADAAGPAVDALKMTLARRNPPDGCVHHSNHGSQYVSLLPSKTMRDNGIRPSMGSISSPWDNAVMESLMGIVRAECVQARTYATREEAALDLFECIEVVYNRVRTHSALGYLSPAELEEAKWPKKEGRPKAA